MRGDYSPGRLDGLFMNVLRGHYVLSISTPLDSVVTALAYYLMLIHLSSSLLESLNTSWLNVFVLFLSLCAWKRRFSYIVLFFYRYPRRGIFFLFISPVPVLLTLSLSIIYVFAKFLYIVPSPIANPPYPSVSYLFCFRVTYDATPPVHFITPLPIVFILAPSHILGYYIAPCSLTRFCF